MIDCTAMISIAGLLPVLICESGGPGVDRGLGVGSQVVKDDIGLPVFAVGPYHFVVGNDRSFLSMHKKTCSAREQVYNTARNQGLTATLRTPSNFWPKIR